MATKKIVPGRAGSEETIQGAARLPDVDDFDYSDIGQPEGEGKLSKLSFVGLVLLVAAGIGGGVFVSSRLPGVEKAVVPSGSAVALVADAKTGQSPANATHININIPKNVPRPPDLTGDTAESWQDFANIEPSAGTPAGASDGSSTTTTTTTTTTTSAPPGNASNVAEVPAQPPAMPSGATSQGAPSASPPMPEVGGASASPTSAAAAPALSAPDENLPSVGGASAPSAAPAGTESADAGATSGTSAAPVSPKPQTAKPSGPDAYYDSAAPPPPGMANVVGPRAVNPVREPGSKFIIVEKNNGPQSTDARVVAADRALKLGHYDAAFDMFDALYKKNPRDPRILMGRAVALQNTGRTEAALKTYDQLLTIDHNNPEALVNMLGILRKEYPEVALRRLMNLHEKYPANAMIAAQVGVTEADQGHLVDAQRFLGMAISMEPNNAQHLFNMAIIEDRAGKKDDAIKYYQQALETDAVYGDSRSVPREQIYDRLSILRQQ